jgi:hypothetical protein
VNVGEPVISTLKAINQSFVIQTQQLQYGRLQVVHVDRVLGDIITKVIRFAISFSWTNSGPGQPDGKTPRMVVSAVIRRR